MTHQLSLLDQHPNVKPLRAARVERDVNMARALDKADRAVTGWPDLAYAFLELHARRHQYFISEDVSDASKAEQLEQPPTDRAWGSIYTKAAKAGLIVQDGSGRSRRRHASICPRWRSLIYAGPRPAA